MNIETAQRLRVGSTVHCPPDRGDKGYTGKVEHVTPTEVRENWRGDKFLWVKVRGPDHASIWPSNRLYLVTP